MVSSQEGCATFPVAPVLRYTRHKSKRFTYQHGGKTFEGVRGVLRVLRVQQDGTEHALVECPTVERGDGYARMKPGAFVARADVYRPRGAASTVSGLPQVIQALRVLNVPVWRRVRGELIKVFLDTLLFHPANRPDQLEGCVAPGCQPTAYGVQRSTLAMSYVFEMLGGFRRGEEYELTVTEE